MTTTTEIRLNDEEKQVNLPSLSNTNARKPGIIEGLSCVWIVSLILPPYAYSESKQQVTIPL